MKAPKNAVSLMATIYMKVLPVVAKELHYWKERASQIPNEELRTQALASIEQKTFHCEGGAIYAILAGEKRKECIRFIVAYQTISDYLDNLCDRSTSLDPKDFSALHESMRDTVAGDSAPNNYYRFRDDQDDGGYLQELVTVCQEMLQKTKHYDNIKSTLQILADLYCHLQVHKHVAIEEREERLITWFEENKQALPAMTWYEFSACTGSTLCIFCLVAYAFQDELAEVTIANIYHSYFPYVQGLHILLDYFIDQSEDVEGGDLNFCSYYESNEHMIERLEHFIVEADRNIKKIPDAKFHLLINKGLIGIYLSDQKIEGQQGMKAMAKHLLGVTGGISRFFYFNGKIYRKLSRSY